MKIVKNLYFIVFLLVSLPGFAQKFTIKSDHGNIFYLDAYNAIKINVEGFDSSKITATCSKFNVLKREEGKYTINFSTAKLGQRDVGDSVIISVFVEKVEKGLTQAKEGKTIAHENVKEIAKKW